MFKPITFGSLRCPARKLASRPDVGDYPSLSGKQHHSLKAIRAKLTLTNFFGYFLDFVEDSCFFGIKAERGGVGFLNLNAGWHSAAGIDW